MNKLFKNILVSVTLLLTAFIFVACGKSDVKDPTFINYAETYEVNDEFVLEGTKLRIWSSKTEYEDIVVTESMIKSLPDLTTTGEKTVTITYDGKEYTFKINVLPAILRYEFINLKEYYEINSNFDMNDVKLKIYYTDGTDKTVNISPNNISRTADMSTTGIKTIEFASNGKHFEYEFLVRDSSVEMKKLLSDFATKYKNGESKGDITSSVSIEFVSEFLGDEVEKAFDLYNIEIDESMFDENASLTKIYQAMLNGIVKSSTNFDNASSFDYDLLKLEYEIIDSLKNIMQEMNSANYKDFADTVLTEYIFIEEDSYYIDLGTDLLSELLNITSTQGNTRIKVFVTQYYNQLFDYESHNIEDVMPVFEELYDIFYTHTNYDKQSIRYYKSLFDEIVDFDRESIPNIIRALGEYSSIHSIGEGSSELTDDDALTIKTNYYEGIALLTQSFINYYIDDDFSTTLQELITALTTFNGALADLELNQYVICSAYDDNKDFENDSRIEYKSLNLYIEVLTIAKGIYDNGFANYMKDEGLAEISDYIIENYILTESDEYYIDWISDVLCEYFNITNTTGHYAINGFVTKYYNKMFDYNNHNISELSSALNELYDVIHDNTEYDIDIVELLKECYDEIKGFDRFSISCIISSLGEHSSIYKINTIGVAPTKDTSTEAIILKNNYYYNIAGFAQTLVNYLINKDISELLEGSVSFLENHNTYLQELSNKQYLILNPFEDEEKISETTKVEYADYTEGLTLLQTIQGMYEEGAITYINNGGLIDLTDYLLHTYILTNDDTTNKADIVDHIVYYLNISDLGIAEVEAFVETYYTKLLDYRNHDIVDFDGAVDRLITICVNYSEIESRNFNFIKDVYEEIRNFDINTIPEIINLIGDYSEIIECGEDAHILTSPEAIAFKTSYYKCYADLATCIINFSVNNNIGESLDEAIEIVETLNTLLEDANENQYDFLPPFYQYNSENCNYIVEWEPVDAYLDILNTAKGMYEKGVIDFLRESQIVETLFNVNLENTFGTTDLTNVHLETINTYDYEEDTYKEMLVISESKDIYETYDFIIFHHPEDNNSFYIAEIEEVYNSGESYGVWGTTIDSENVVGLVYDTVECNDIYYFEVVSLYGLITLCENFDISVLTEYAYKLIEGEEINMEQCITDLCNMIGFDSTIYLDRYNNDGTLYLLSDIAEELTLDSDANFDATKFNATIIAMANYLDEIIVNGFEPKTFIDLVHNFASEGDKLFATEEEYEGSKNQFIYKAIYEITDTNEGLIDNIYDLVEQYDGEITDVLTNYISYFFEFEEDDKACVNLEGLVGEYVDSIFNKTFDVKSLRSDVITFINNNFEDNSGNIALTSLLTMLNLDQSIEKNLNDLAKRYDGIIKDVAVYTLRNFFGVSKDDENYKSFETLITNNVDKIIAGTFDEGVFAEDLINHLGKSWYNVDNLYYYVVMGGDALDILFEDDFEWYQGSIEFITKYRDDTETFLSTLIAYELGVDEDDEAVEKLQLLVAKYLDGFIAKEIDEGLLLSESIEFINTYCDKDTQTVFNSILAFSSFVYAQSSDTEVDYNEIFSFIELPEAFDIDYNVLIAKLISTESYKDMFTFSNVNVELVKDGLGNIVKEIITFDANLDFDMMITSINAVARFRFEIEF